MEFQTAKAILVWCLAINYGILFVWFFAFVFAKKLMYSIHTRLFALKEEEFDSIHYRSMAQYKIMVILFNLTPYLALVAVS